MKRLNYKEKVRYAEKVAYDMESGTKVEEITAWLKEEELMEFDIEKVLKSSDSILSEKYGLQIREYLLSQTLEDHLDEFDNLDTDTFHRFQHEQYDYIIKSSRSKVHELAKKGITESEIVKLVCNPYFNQEDVSMALESYTFNNVPISGWEKRDYQTIGILSIVAGIAFSFIFSSSGSMLLLYGLVIFGIRNIYKAYSTRSEIVSMDKRSNRLFKK